MFELRATTRTAISKANVNSLRRTGKIPAVVYGKKVGNVPLAVDEREFTQFERNHGLHTIFKLDWGEASSPVVVGDIQRDFLRGKILHVDFKEADPNTKMIIEIPIEWVGEEEAEKKSLVLQRPVYALEVIALPAHLPEKIEVDLSQLEVGDTITVGDIKFGEGVEPQLPADTVIVTALAPAKEAVKTEETDESAEEAAEEE